MTDLLDLDALEKVARAATPGEWRSASPKDSGTIFIQSREVRHPNAEGRWADVAMVSKICWDYDKDADYIATFDPPTCIALLDAARAVPPLQVEVDRLREALTRAERGLTWGLGLIVEFADLNGFRNMTDQELGASVHSVAVAVSEALDVTRAALTPSESGEG